MPEAKPASWSAVPAEITLPYDTESGRDSNGLTAMIYKEITEDYDPVYTVSGAAPLRIDKKAGRASFDVQVFGNYFLVAGE